MLIFFHSLNQLKSWWSEKFLQCLKRYTFRKLEDNLINSLFSIISVLQILSLLIFLLRNMEKQGNGNGEKKETHCKRKIYLLSVCPFVFENV